MSKRKSPGSGPEAIAKGRQAGSLKGGNQPVVLEAQPKAREERSKMSLSGEQAGSKPLMANIWSTLHRATEVAAERVNVWPQPQILTLKAQEAQAEASFKLLDNSTVQLMWHSLGEMPSLSL